MPVPTVEKLKDREATLKQALAGGAAGDAAKRRTLAKRLRRAQRKRRKILRRTAKHAPPSPAAGAPAG